MGRAVDMRLEGDARLVDLAQLRQRHDLEAAGVGEDRERPVHEAVQPAEARDALRAGPQHQVVGVAEHHVGAERLHLIRVHGLDGRRRADRHEGGRADDAARHPDFAGARRAVGFVTVKVKVSDMPVVNRHPGSPFHIEPICHSGASEARARNP